MTWCAVVNMVIIPCAYSRTRDEILWRHAAMVEAGLSETGGITGALGKAASRVVPDPMLGFITSRLCIGWPRGDARGSFHSSSHAKRGASPLRLPACRAGQQCVSPPNCRPGPRSSRSGQCFPRSRTKRPGQEGQPPLVLSCCCFLSWRLRRHQFENRDVRLVCHQRLGVGDHAPRTPGRACRRGSRARPGKILLFCHWLTIKHHLQAREDGKPII